MGGRHAFNGVDLLFERRFDEAAAELRAALEISPGLPMAAQTLMAVNHARGSRAEALASRASRTFVSTYDLAMLFAYAGDADGAFEWIDRGIDARDPNLAYVSSPDIASLHGDPRFAAAMRRLGLPR